MDWKKLRHDLALVALPLLVVALLYYFNCLDFLAKKRVRFISQDVLETSKGNRWFGIECWQYPEDLMVYQEIVHEVRPDFIIETGTYYGGLTVYLAWLLEAVNPDGKVIAIDVNTHLLRETLRSL